MRFNEIFALEDIKKELLNGISKNRIAHSQIFTGPKGGPKTVPKRTPLAPPLDPLPRPTFAKKESPNPT